MKCFLFIFIILISSTSMAQKSDTVTWKFNSSVSYHYLNLCNKRGPGGMRLDFSAEKNWMEFGLVTQYNRLNFYKVETSNSRLQMNDQYMRIGAFINFRPLRLRRSEFWIGPHVEKFFLLRHYYLYENFSTAVKYESVCRVCHGVISSEPLAWGFAYEYLWQFGTDLRFNYWLTPRFSISLLLEADFLLANGWRSISQYFVRETYFSLSPNIGFKYTFATK